MQTEDCKLSVTNSLNHIEKLEELSDESLPSFEKRRVNASHTVSLSKPPPLNPMTKSLSSNYENEDFKEGSDIKRLKGKFKTFVELSQTKQLSIETKSMFQITEDANLKNSMPQQSFTSLTSLEGMNYRNSFEIDIEDEDFCSEYKIVGYLGQGAHAIVKKIQNVFTNEIFAAKITRVNDEEILQAIINEFEILKKLDHNYILKAYNLKRLESMSVIILIIEFVDCDNLTNFLAKPSNVITEIIALKILKKLLIAVNYLHQNSICHRDISPQNILISDDLSIFKLVDFGVSKHFRNGKTNIEMITPTGIPAYRAPEIFKGRKFDEKVDEWGCGHVFFEILTQKHISSKKLYKILKNKELIDIIKNFTLETQNLLAKLLELNPKKRASVIECLDNPIFVDL